MHSHSTRDLNAYDDFFGNFRDPIIRANENSLSSTDVPHRWIVRGSLGLPGKWVFSPMDEFRTGFPWSAVNEFQDFVGPRNETGRLPRVSTLDFSLTRPFGSRISLHLRLRVYNVFCHRRRARRAGQYHRARLRHLLQPDSRSIGIVLSAGFP